MEKKNSPIALRIISLILLIGWMGLIFYLSHQDANKSSDMSTGFIKYAVNIFAPQIDGNELTILIASLQFIVRKTAHFSLYAVLGILAFSNFASINRLCLFLKGFLSLAVSAAYAVSDEYHQTFISGRSGELRDVLIDSLGAFTGIILALIIYKIHKAFLGRRLSKMKKKQYMELVDTLGQRLNAEKLKTEELLGENSALNAELSELRERIAALENAQKPVIKEIEEPVAELPSPALPVTLDIKTEPILSDAINDGAKIIGKIVLSSAKYCNNLTMPGANPNAKELVNLILGRTEIAKAEILRLSALNMDSAERLSAMERELSSAEEYFKSIMAQK